MKFKEFIENTIHLPYKEWSSELLNFNEVGRNIALDLHLLRQDTKWHPEIYVLKHTYYVLKALEEVGANELYEAGLFHDWGKKNSTLLHKNGNITSYGHASIGADLVEEYSEFLESDVEVTKWIVERHMDFDVGHKRFKQKDKYDEPYDLLETFIWADKQRSRELFFEVEGYQQYFKNVSTIHRFKYIDEKYPVKLYLNIGISGSGKSTIPSVKKEFPVICPDNIRKEILGYVGFEKDKEPTVWNLTKQRIIGQLNIGNSCVLDATNVNRYSRVKLISYIKSKVHVRFTTVGLIYPYVDIDVARMRIEKDLKTKDRSDVSIEVLRRQQKSLMDSMKEGFSDLDELRIVNY